MHIPVGVHVDSIGTGQFFVPTRCKLLARPHRQSTREFLGCAAFEKNSASNHWFTPCTFESLTGHGRWLNTDRARRNSEALRGLAGKFRLPVILVATVELVIADA